MYLDMDAWDAVRDKVIAENLLQSRMQSTSRRICQEVLIRLQTLSKMELKFLIKADYRAQTYVLWIAICRRYRFIAEFAVEVLYERHITLKNQLEYDDFDSFYNRKSEWHSELDILSKTTRSKLRQVLFRMLRELDFLSKHNEIRSSTFSRELLKLVCQNNPGEIMYFPVVESDLRRVGQ